MYEELYAEGKTAGEAAERLEQIIRALRGEDGCPWDRAQTHEMLKRCLIEECYEVTEAIDCEDMDNLEEELGDVLLQVVMHSCLAEENGKFDLKGVTNRVCEKMIRRHPHVFEKKKRIFSNNEPETIDNVLEKWENVKSKEHEPVSRSESMRKIPRQLPALLQSEKIQKKAANVGFDWDRIEDVFDKVKEESLELFEICQGDDSDHIKEEVGDLLFSVVNVARFLGVDPEEALRLACQKFIDRFEYIEKSVCSQGRLIEETPLEEMDKLWEAAKEKENA